jgi:predicted molibdopterin-dependent oxidoreductase YjgC
MSAVDAARLEISEGDLVEIRTPRSAIRASVRVSGIRPGVLFVPFHYGYFDRGGSGPDVVPGRAANELTATMWDAVSKQPLFKTAAASVRLVQPAEGRPSPAPTVGGPAPVTVSVAPTVGGADGVATEEALERS